MTTSPARNQLVSGPVFGAADEPPMALMIWLVVFLILTVLNPDVGDWF